jgi:hypothetical protein
VNYSRYPDGQNKRSRRFRVSDESQQGRLAKGLFIRNDLLQRRRNIIRLIPELDDRSFRQGQRGHDIFGISTPNI